MGNCNDVEAKNQPVEMVAPEEAPPAPDAPKLTVNIIGARGLRNADWFPGMGTSDCFCRVRLVGKEASLFKTTTINNTLTPLWQHEAEITDFTDGDSLEFSIWDEDIGKSPDFLGKAVLNHGDFANSGFNGELQLDEAGKGIKAFLRVKVKVAGQSAYPAGPPTEFTIKFDKDPKVKSLGLDFDLDDGKYIYVTGVKAGPFKRYNEQADTDKQLRPGDFLVKINGKAGDSQQLADELKMNRSFEILARHPEEICIAIDKKEPKAKMGIEWAAKPKGNAVLIHRVNDGPFKVWNDTNEDQKVCDHDRVVSVAGFQGKGADLKKKMLNTTAFQAIVVRPAVAL